MGRWAARLAELLAEKRAEDPGAPPARTDGTPFRQLWQCPAGGVAADFSTAASDAAAVDTGPAAVPAVAPMALPTDDPIPSGGREVLGLLDLGGMSADELAAGLGWRRGEALGMLLRLRALGAVRQAGARWVLTRAADRYAVPLHPLGAAVEQRAIEGRTTRDADPSGRTLDAPEEAHAG
jgi:hypothetical protein